MTGFWWRKVDKVRKFFYELACWSIILALLWLFWYGFGRSIDGGSPLDERGTDTYRGVDL